ncbi:response regulator transcription factor [Kocuria rhizophila]|uniref:response regulator transcription factor n=1 Tax=Kocuria rhizophila TaxID=72000 RepID=UPI002949F871|nr:response regulator transcription factor [Kocuria rhizophila]MDV5999525.1 response regulator transcription factor [Kocuria rhizophila]
MTTRVLLVDDHPVVRAGLRAVLESLGDITVCAEAQDGRAALERLGTEDHSVDVVVMDLQMGRGMGGLEATRRIVASGGPPVLILTTYDTQADVVAALEAGATGYLLKDAQPETIGQAVHDAAAGRPVLSPSVTARLMTQIRTPAASLSPREIEILRGLATGASNRALAKSLFISEATVKTHLVHIYEKLGVDNRTAAVSRAREEHVI